MSVRYLTENHHCTVSLNPPQYGMEYSGWSGSGSSYRRGLFDLAAMAVSTGASHRSYSDPSKQAHALSQVTYGYSMHGHSVSGWSPANRKQVACYSNRGTSPAGVSVDSLQRRGLGTRCPSALATASASQAGRFSQQWQGARAGPLTLKESWETDPCIAPLTKALIDRDFRKWRSASTKVYSLWRKLHSISEACPESRKQGDPQVQVPAVAYHGGAQVQAVPQQGGRDAESALSFSSLAASAEVEDEAELGYCAVLTSLLKMAVGMWNGAR